MNISGVIMSRASPASQSSKTWQQTKSQNTRKTILDAAIHCFYQFGYNNTTTEKIAHEAKVSRGAMLHHFPSRADLIKAAVLHLNEKRLELFKREENTVQSDATHSRIDEGIDTYWAQLNTPYFVVFHELQIAARTDLQLYTVLIPAIEELDRAWAVTVREVFPDLALSPEIIRANWLTLLLLEGMAANLHTRGLAKVAEDLLAWLKTELRRSFNDVLTSLDRESAKKVDPIGRKSRRTLGGNARFKAPAKPRAPTVRRRPAKT
ncbi:MAG: TetR/AcrR family transcriptional regulator [Proteobacteria bacterium]|nr:TetR/AcrR family transcriptional regulator [Pseudomonadota bacterium]